MDDAVSAVLARIEARIESTERRLDDLGAAGRRAGENVDEGAEQAEEGLRDQEEQTERTREETERLREETRRQRDEQRRSREETDRSSGAWDRYERKLKKSAKSMGGFSRVIRAMKWTVMIGAVFAAAGAISALGAAAVMAAGNLVMMLPGLAALGPIGLAAALGMKAAKLGLAEMEPEAERIKSMFAGLGAEVANGGFRSGLDYLADKMGPFADEVAQGFGWIGGSLGNASRSLGDFLAETYRLDQTEKLFWSVSNIIDSLTPGVLGFGGALMNILTAAIPGGERLATVLGALGIRAETWTRAWLESGRGTEVINAGVEKLINASRTLWNFMAGLYNIFKIAAAESQALGLNLDDLSVKFRAWTNSTEGQAQIAQYFRDALPAIRELGLLVWDLTKGLAGLATSQDVAPLLNQLRTEFLPALFDLVAMISGQGGLLPAVLDAGTELAKMFTGLDLSAVTFLAQAFAELVAGIAYLIETVPGLGMLVSLFATLYVVGGAILTVAAKMVAAWAWLAVARAGTGQLTLAQKALNWVLRMGRIALFNLRLAWFAMGGAAGIVSTIMSGITWVARAMWVAITGPVGLVVLAIAAVIAIVILLWNNCEWFRNAVIAAWEWIKNAAVATWLWIQNAAATTWSAITGFVSSAIAVIGAILNWLWLNIVQPVWNGIVMGAQIAWAIISFIVQTAIFIIVGIITVLALILQGIWWLVSTAATWAWQNVILPVIQFVAGIAIAVWTAVAAFFTWLWGIIVQQAQFAWNGVILPAIQFVAGIAISVWTAVAAFFGWLWGMISSAATAVWNGVIAPVFAVVAGIAMAVWSPISAFFSNLFGIIGRAGSAAFDGISRAAGVVAGVVRGAWDAVVGAVRGAYNAIARGWNSIPSITVPAWVPLIGGSTFSLPRLPTLWHGGTIEYGAAVVGEQGPEPFIGPNGRYMGMLGANGPEVAAGLPRGGYVVPNLDTLTRMPGLLRGLPSGVANAVASNVPGYAGLIRPSAPPPVAPPAGGSRDRGDREILGALRGLTRAIGDRPPPISADGRDTEAVVLRALRRWERERELRDRYSYAD